MSGEHFIIGSCNRKIEISEIFLRTISRKQLKWLGCYDFHIGHLIQVNW